MKNMMDARFLAHNSHLQNPQTFAQTDPQLYLLSQQKYIFRSSLLGQFPQDTPGVYTLGGGRQIGKSTLLKQWMLQLLGEGVAPERIVFLSGELIPDEQALFSLIEQYLKMQEKEPLKYILLDEVTEIRHWEKAIKYLADAGFLRSSIVLLSGSDLAMMKEVSMYLPGRRGIATQTDFHYYPLSFREYLALMGIETKEPALLNNALIDYLRHGGYLMAINDLARYGRILPSTLNVYVTWLRGDILKRGKREHYLKEILAAIVKHTGSQITWNTLSHSLSIDHPATVIDYCNLLSNMDAVFIQQALIEDKLVGAPKKARKLMFCDPFIYHAVRYWLAPTEHPYETQILPLLHDAEGVASLVEACVVTHFQRFYPTYYIKAEGEIDLAYIKSHRFYPIEIKWRNQVRASDLKQLAKYHQAECWVKETSPPFLPSIDFRFLSQALALL